MLEIDTPLENVGILVGIAGGGVRLWQFEKGAQLGQEQLIISFFRPGGVLPAFAEFIHDPELAPGVACLLYTSHRLGVQFPHKKQ